MRESRVATDYARFPGKHDNCRLRPGVDTDHVERLDLVAGLFPCFANRAFMGGLVDLEETARLRPQPAAGFDAAPDQDKPIVRRDWQRADDEARVQVSDEAAVAAREPVASLTL